MHLHLSFPPPWQVKHAPRSQHAAILPGPPGAPTPDAVVTFGPLQLKPDEPRAWQEGLARGDLPPDARVVLGRTLDRSTVAGWPLRLIEAEVTDAKTSRVIEVRLCAFYTFLEHAGCVIVRAGSRERLEPNGKAIVAILEAGRPDWRGEPACVADLWDLEPAQRQPQRQRAILPQSPGPPSTELAEVEAELAARATPLAHVRRGGLLLDSGRSKDALQAFEAAIALDPTCEPAHYFRGIALGDLDRHADAAAAWESALAIAPDRIDTRYNLAQARFLLREFESALAGFQHVVTADAADFMTLRKLAQCCYALGRFEEGERARRMFRERWASSSDPRARFITEFVFDQFDGPDFAVHAIETLRPAAGSVTRLLEFRAVRTHHGHDHPLPASVFVETSEQARAANTPFVLGVTAQGQFKVVAVAKQLPPYPELRGEVIRLLVAALQAQPPPSP